MQSPIMCTRSIHCLFSNREGLGTSLSIMGLETIVIKCRPSFTKSSSLVKIDPIVSKIQPFENAKIYKEMNGHPKIRMLSDTASGWPYISLLFLTFLNHGISVKTSLINTKLGDFVNLGVLFLTIWINSC